MGIGEYLYINISSVSARDNILILNLVPFVSAAGQTSSDKWRSLAVSDFCDRWDNSLSSHLFYVITKAERCALLSSVSCITIDLLKLSECLIALNVVIMPES